MERIRDKSINRETLKTLVIAFGPREAARQSGVNVNTVLSLARRHKWKRNPSTESDASSLNTVNANGAILQPNGNGVQNPICTLSPPNALATILARLKHDSVEGISTYCAKAARALASSENPLAITGKAKDIADVHRTMWPQENSRNDILQIGILINASPVASTPRDSLGNDKNS